jgi:hypothetical protein
MSSGQLSFWANVSLGKYHLGQCLSGQMSFWANVFVGKCLSGQMSFWANVIWANVVWANVTMGKRRMDKCLGKCRLGKSHGTVQHKGNTISKQQNTQVGP